ALEHDGAPVRADIVPPRPRHGSGGRREEAHGQAQQRGLAGAVRPDQHGRRTGRERQRHAIQNSHRAGGEVHVGKYDRQVGERRAHDHPASRSSARRNPQASALTMITMVISTSPSPMASGRSPFDVSSAIAVVMVRVKPSMLPPTIITAPTSAAARPKPASAMVTSEKRASQSSTLTREEGPTAMAVNSSRYSARKSAITCRGNAAMIAEIRTCCALITARGVKRIPNLPSGQERDSSK